MAREQKIVGAGLGLRREHLSELATEVPEAVQFVEVAPENWIKAPKARLQLLDKITSQVPLVCHGLSLSLGGPSSLDNQLLNDIKQFIQDHKVVHFTEHLSYCSDEGHLYDLIPIPFTRQAADYTADRIKKAQDILGQPIAVENISYYCAPGQEMPEIDFINRVLDQADCKLLLDINNIHVNSINHNYDADYFLRQLPSDRISYGHIAGHFVEQPNLIIDSHGADICKPVWHLLEKAFQWHGVFPVLLERDFNLPSLDQLTQELQQIQHLQEAITNQGRQCAYG